MVLSSPRFDPIQQCRDSANNQSADECGPRDWEWRGQSSGGLVDLGY
jgi:hypothetical protein